MSVTRRQLLAASGTLAAGVAVVGAGMMMSPEGDTLVLHGGDRIGRDFAAAIRRATPGARVTDHAVAVLAPGGFAQVAALLVKGRGRQLVALLDDGDAVAIEAMLGGRMLTRARHGARVRVTGRL